MATPSRGQQSSSRGFTLIELLIVIAVIGLIAAIAIPAMQFALDRSKQRATLSDMRMIGGAIAQYNIDHSYFPNGTLSAPQLAQELLIYSGNNIPWQDRWLHDFAYASDQQDSYSIESFGRDGLDGTDITYGTRNDFNLDLVFANGQFRNTPEQ